MRNKLLKMSGQIRSRKQELAMHYRNTMLNIQLLQSLLLWQIETPADMRGKLWTVWRGCTAFSLAPWWGGIIHETMNSMKRLYCIFSYPMMGRDNSWAFFPLEDKTQYSPIEKGSKYKLQLRRHFRFPRRLAVTHGQ